MQPSILENHLLKKNILDQKMLLDAINKAQNQQQTLLHYLANNQIVSSELLVQIAVEIFHLPLVDLTQYSMEDIVISKMSPELITQTKAIPLKESLTQLDIAISDPSDLKNIDLIKFHTGLNINIFLARYDHIQQLIKQLVTQKNTKSLGTLKTDIKEAREIYELDFAQEDDEPLVRFVNNMIEDAVCTNASDIHFEVYEKNCRVRFRQDGILYEINNPPKHVAQRLAARLKIMAKLDISERRIPQDGNFKIKVNEKQSVEIRVSSCPTVYGEKIVLRLLNSRSILKNISQLDLNERQQQDFLENLNKPQGLILVTGPTGSGKTVTLYAALQYLNKTEKNISTVEDPVEINLLGINQVGVNPKAGLTFSQTLRAFLRQDPDIIMIGEIRDLETAEIAIKAAQTGHLVLSTLHTNSAVEALTRLRNMGIASYNIASSVILITAQRLARILCPHCKQACAISPAIQKQFSFLSNEKFFKAKGCCHCTNGYQGRFAIHEVLPADEKLQEIILQENNKAMLEKILNENEFVSLRRAGIEKVADGTTSLEEIYRVIG